MNEDLWGTTTSQWGTRFISLDSATNSVMSISGNGYVHTPNGTRIEAKKPSKMPVKIFFGLMKKKMGILKDYSYQRRIKQLEQAVEKAEKDGQIAFSEELLKRLLVLCREAEMWAMGKKIFLSRTDFDKFKDKTVRSIALTPLKNFARPIPQDVLDEKTKCDQAKLFDGYAVMHYDDKNTVKETEQDKKERRERDPILFGVVQYSDKLYFVADWEDEYCDLTLDDIIDRLDLKDEDTTLAKKIII